MQDALSLITIKNLNRLKFRALGPEPDWVIVQGRPTEEFADFSPFDHAVAVALGRKHKTTRIWSLVQLAILYELTRFGGSVNTNVNKVGGDVYVKFTFSGQNVVLNRLWADAGPSTGVDTPPQPNDERPYDLVTGWQGKAIANGRDKALKLARSAAQRAKLSPDLIAGYEANIRELFNALDQHVAEQLGLTVVRQ